MNLTEKYLNEEPEDKKLNMKIYKELKNLVETTKGKMRSIKTGDFPYDTKEHLREVLEIDMRVLRMTADSVMRMVK